MPSPFRLFRGNSHAESLDIGTQKQRLNLWLFYSANHLVAPPRRMPFLSSILFVTYSTINIIGLLLSGKIKGFPQVRGMKWNLARSTQRKARSRAAWFPAPLSPRRPFSSRTGSGGESIERFLLNQS
jgi:hypothetical protein